MKERERERERERESMLTEKGILNFWDGKWVETREDRKCVYNPKTIQQNLRVMCKIPTTFLQFDNQKMAKMGICLNMKITKLNPKKPTTKHTNITCSFFVSSNLTSSFLDAVICESRRLDSFLGELNPLSNRLGGVESALFTNQVMQ